MYMLIADIYETQPPAARRSGCCALRPGTRSPPSRSAALCSHVCVYIYIYLSLSLSLSLYIYALYIYIYIRIHIYIYICIHTRIGLGRL